MNLLIETGHREGVFGLLYDNVSFKEAITELLRRAHGSKRDPLAVFTSNVQHFYLYRISHSFHWAYLECGMSLLDGMPLVWICWVQGKRNVERITGSDLFAVILPEALKEGLTVYLLDGESGVADRAAIKLCGKDWKRLSGGTRRNNDSSLYCQQSVLSIPRWGGVSLFEPCKTVYYFGL